MGRYIKILLQASFPNTRYSLLSTLPKTKNEFRLRTTFKNNMQIKGDS